MKESKSLGLVSWCTTDIKQTRKKQKLCVVLNNQTQMTPRCHCSVCKIKSQNIEMSNVCHSRYLHAQCFIKASAFWYADYLVTPSSSACGARSTCASRAPSADANLMPCMSLPRWAVFFTSTSFCEPFFFSRALYHWRFQPDGSWKGNSTL